MEYENPALLLQIPATFLKKFLVLDHSNQNQEILNLPNKCIFNALNITFRPFSIPSSGLASTEA